MFTIDRSTGGIVLRRSISGQPSEMRFDVQVEDGGGLKSEASSQVVIRVVPPCMFPPVFDHLMYNFTIKENVLVDTAVGQVLNIF